MLDMEKIIKELYRIISVLFDALSLLKEQEKQKFFVDENGKITPLPVIVRCKDCKKRKTDKCLMYWNEIKDDETWDDDWFCADGERRESE